MEKEFDKLNLYKIVQAMAQGYHFKLYQDFETDGPEYLVTDNPDYRPDNGSDPCMVLDISEFHKFCHS